VSTTVFPVTIANSPSGYPTLTVTPPNSFIYATQVVTIKASLTLYPNALTDTSYSFNLHTNTPYIVSPAIASSTISCYALSNCSLNIGEYSVNSSCSGESLAYYFTFNSGQYVTSVNYNFYTMNLTTYNDNLTYFFMANNYQIGLTYSIVITASIFEFPEVTNTKYVFGAYVLLDCRVLKFMTAPTLDN
jgi:hypothetical protein